MKRYHALWVMLALSGCTMMQPFSYTTRTGTLILYPQIQPGRLTQASVLPYDKASIHHLKLKLYTFTGTEQDTGVSKTLPNSDLDRVVLFSDLKPNKTYRVWAYAYASSDDSLLISTSATSSMTEVTVLDNDRPTLAAIKVTLIDRPFTGGASASLAIVPGGYLPMEPENGRFLGPNGLVTTLAGGDATESFDGTGSGAGFKEPMGVTVDSQGNVYVAEYSSYLIRKVTPTGVVTTFAGNATAGSQDGTGTMATFFKPHGLAIDKQDNLYVAEQYNHRVRKITPQGVVSTLAGNGTLGSQNAVGTLATFYHPSGLAVDSLGNVYVADMWNNLVRKITSDGTVTTIAGNGSAAFKDGSTAEALFNHPCNVALDARGDLYVADWYNYRIRKITKEGQVSTFIGDGIAGYRDGQGTATRVYDPEGLAFDSQGFLYFVDRGAHRIRRISPTGFVTTLAGSGATSSADGFGVQASFNRPMGLGIDAQGNLYVGESNNRRVRKIQ